MARNFRSRKERGQSSTRDGGSKERSGPEAKKQEWFECGQPSNFAWKCKKGRTGLFSYCATTSMKGDKRKLGDLIMWCAIGLLFLA